MCPSSCWAESNGVFRSRAQLTHMGLHLLMPVTSQEVQSLRRELNLGSLKCIWPKKLDLNRMVWREHWYWRHRTWWEPFEHAHICMSALVHVPPGLIKPHIHSQSIACPALSQGCAPLQSASKLLTAEWINAALFGASFLHTSSAGSVGTVPFYNYKLDSFLVPVNTVLHKSAQWSLTTQLLLAGACFLGGLVASCIRTMMPGAWWRPCCGLCVSK